MKEQRAKNLTAKYAISNHKSTIKSVLKQNLQKTEEQFEKNLFAQIEFRIYIAAVRKT